MKKEHLCVCDLLEEDGEDDVNAADAGNSGTVHPFIRGGRQMPQLPVV